MKSNRKYEEKKPEILCIFIDIIFYYFTKKVITYVTYLI